MGASGKKKAATIYDIAKSVGVSGATVSRAINNKGYISDELKERIYKTAKELNYIPNPAARSLKTRRTNQIMLSTIYLRDYFNFDMIEAVQNTAKSHGYSLLLNFTGDNENEEIKMLKNVRENFVDGLILVSLNFTEKHMKEIMNIQYPIVLTGICTNRIVGGEGLFDYVGVDTQKGTYIATKHLISQGHTEIGYVGLPSKIQSWDERYRGFCMAMEEAGLKQREEYIITGGYDENFGYEAGLTYAKLKKRPTAICASADMIVIGLYRAFEHEGIRIPEDICIVGMDNIDLDTLVKPKISSVAIAQADIGRTAAELIFRRLDGSNEPFQDIIFQPRLIVRESSVNKVL